MNYKLDKFENSLEADYNKHKSIKTQAETDLFQKSAAAHLKNSKLGLSSQTYLNKTYIWH